ncbi:DpnII family type II restriction endonuclease [Leptotrichia massiliensis]|uniref:DpnII family type II restriction endonuclease n=1 Tax=Leptotrichia massiliensis TaxID=1852388 RepID=UPI0028D6EAC3|nr:DpnII family type II restriction endonuclease [Leptotrichia massiliensis]
MTQIKVKPFLKWVGGKGQLIDKIEKFYPFDNKINKYAEPFIGGGAVLFDILNKFELEKIYISDVNIELLNCYKVIKEKVQKLVDKLKVFEKEFLVKDKEDRKIYYYEKREQFNKLKLENNSEEVKRAALMIFLNRTCFNGLYRVNKKGLFNVPMGDYKNPKICDEENLINISKKLKNVDIIYGDYKKSYDFIDKNTFVYFDPPYRPLNQTSSFTSYTEYTFEDKEQIELSEYFKLLNKKGAKLLLSNSDPKNENIEDNFFDDLYKEFDINRIEANRSINSNGGKRGKITEILVNNMEGTKESTMKKRNFNKWLENFRDSIASYEYYVDFKKVFKNVNDIKIELNILNSLIGSQNIKEDFENIIEKYPETLKCIPILLAVRKKEIYVIDVNGEYVYSFKKRNYPVEQYSEFMEKTGLFRLLKEHRVNNLFDYVIGVETGLDSNGRKNRGGHLMEDLVESFIQNSGFEKNKNYFKEMYTSEIEKKWNIDLSAISNTGKTEKRFDFVIKTENQIYVIETNFYASGGSKLNETARSYKTITREVNTIEGVTFIWFTDGTGWKSARHNLEETFDMLEHIYSINDLENDIIRKIIK